MESGRSFTCFFTCFFYSIFYKVYLDSSFMENKISEDIGGEIISRLKDLVRMLEIKYREERDGKEFSDTYISRN